MKKRPLQIMLQVVTDLPVKAIRRSTHVTFSTKSGTSLGKLKLVEQPRIDPQPRNIEIEP